MRKFALSSTGGRASGSAALPRSVYVHVPFCAHHCGYCNFSVIADRADLVDQYLLAIAWELGQLPARFELDTLYLGGGTPTQLAGEQLTKLFEMIRCHFSLTDGCEVTCEANPADVDQRKMQLLISLGVNRISLGAQSFQHSHLQLLERDHGRDDIVRSVELARNCGIHPIAIDLMFAIPGQTIDDWKRDLDACLALSPDHISTYGLTFEKGTTFYGRLQKNDLRQAPEELERAMYLAAIDALTAAGYEHYEISNFALPGQRSRHNQVYWTGQPYLAFGPGAARFVDGVRSTNHGSVTTYLRRIGDLESPIAESEQLSPEDSARERLIFGLRRLEGINLPEFHAETGFDALSLAGQDIQHLVDLGLLEIAEQQLRLTRAGLLISDSIWPQLL